MPRNRKRGHSQGLDQLGPRRVWGTSKQDFFRSHSHTANARAKISSEKRKVKITLSDHLFSSDEIKTKEDE